MVPSAGLSDALPSASLFVGVPSTTVLSTVLVSAGVVVTCCELSIGLSAGLLAAGFFATPELSLSGRAVPPLTASGPLLTVSFSGLLGTAGFDFSIIGAVGLLTVGFKGVSDLITGLVTSLGSVFGTEIGVLGGTGFGAEVAGALGFLEVVLLAPC